MDYSLFDIIQANIWILIKLGIPLLGVILIVGLIVSLFQALTQINDLSLSFVAKMTFLFVILALGGRWFFLEISEVIKFTYRQAPFVIKSQLDD